MLIINFNLLVFVLEVTFAKKQNLKIYQTMVEDHIDQSLIALYFFHIEINFSAFDKFTL